VKEVVMGGACNMYGGEILTNILVGTPERKKPLGRSRHRREDNVAVDLKEMRIDLAVCGDKRRVRVNTVTNLSFPCKCVHNFQANLEPSISQE
jgi:hypothetical protein